MAKYLIFGTGYLGNKFKERLKDSVLSDARIKSSEDVVNEIKKHNPEVVINCAGKVGKPNVEWCEDHKLETFEGNVVLPFFILKACQETGKKLVHLSTGCIYSGENNGKGFSEDDEPNFDKSYYSKTKIFAEKMINDYDNILTVRLRLPLDHEPSPRNLINKLMNATKVNSAKNSITLVSDLINITEQLILRNQKGIFNVVNKGPVTYDDLLKIYQEVSGKKMNYELISPDNLHSRVPRSNCILSTSKLENLGIKVPETKEAIKDCLTKFVKLP